MIEVICVLLGAILAILTEIIHKHIETESIKVHCAKLLFYDITSVMKYIITYREDRTIAPSIQYNTEWQKLLLKLDFLSEGEIFLIYQLYELIHDYNCTYKENGFEEAKIYQKPLANMVYGEDFLKVIEILKKKARIKGL